jgi:hypothetical protein
MMPTRHVWGLGAAGAVVVGLLMPMQAAQAEGTCPTSGTGTISLTADCTLDATWVVPDGSAIDGNGHTITAGPGSYSGAVITNAAGAPGSPATMTIGHLTLDASGVSGVDGIVFDGAKGRVNGVAVTGGDYGVEIKNTAGLSVTFATTDQVKVDNTSSMSGYRLAGVHVTDNMRFTVLRSTIGNPSTGSSDGAAGILVDGLAHGAVTENHISLSHADPASPTAFRAGVEIFQTERVEVKRNVFSGVDADFAVSVSNPAQTSKTTAAVDCNLFRLTGASASTPYGVAVAQWQPASQTKTNVQLTNATFEGNWNRNTGTVDGTTVTAGATNVHTDHCPPSAPTHVSATGGDRRSKVTWHAGGALDYAPVTGYEVKAKAPGHPAVKKSVGANATSATLKGLSNKRTYTVTVTAQSSGGQTAGTDMLFPTKLSLSAPKAIRRGGKAVLRGTLSTADSSVRVSKRPIEIWAKPKGGTWTEIGTVKTESGGHFARTVKPKKRTTYRAVYAGNPGLASSHRATVIVR